MSAFARVNIEQIIHEECIRRGLKWGQRPTEESATNKYFAGTVESPLLPGAATFVVVSGCEALQNEASGTIRELVLKKFEHAERALRLAFLADEMKLHEMGLLSMGWKTPDGGGLPEYMAAQAKSSARKAGTTK